MVHQKQASLKKQYTYICFRLNASFVYKKMNTSHVQIKQCNIAVSSR